MAFDLIGLAAFIASSPSPSPPILMTPPPVAWTKVMPTPPVDLPETRARTIVFSPNWTDYSSYPEEARAHDEQGKVGFALVINQRGTPTACVVTVPSTSEALNLGTCRLAMEMRFAPPTDASGNPIPSSYRARVNWVLSEAVPFASSELVAQLTYENEHLIGCDVSGTGPMVDLWRPAVCGDATIFLSPKYSWKPVVPGPVRHAILTIRVDTGDGLASTSKWPEGRLVARDVTRFSINSDGDAYQCTPDPDGDIFSNNFHSHNPCGHYVSIIWFEDPAKDQPARIGKYELRLVVID